MVSSDEDANKRHKTEKKNMNKIVLSLLMIGTIMGIAGAGTWAYFSDTEQVNGNTFTAGTLDLQIHQNPNEPANYLPFTIVNVKPGDSGSEIKILKNNGNLPGTVYVQVTNVVNDENGLTAPELAIPDIAPVGELGANMNVEIKVGSNIIYSGLVNSVPAGYMVDSDLNPAESKDLTITWSVPGAVGNIIQSDKLSFDVSVLLNQVGEPIP